MNVLILSDDISAGVLKDLVQVLREQEGAILELPAFLGDLGDHDSMFLLEALEIALSAPQLQVDFIDPALEESGELVGVAAFLSGLLGGLAVTLILPQIGEVRLQVLQLVLVLLDYFIAEMRSFGEFLLDFLMQFEVFLEGLDL